MFCKTSGRPERLPGGSGSRDVRILVTGHHGYIGSILTKILRSAGHHVVGVDTNLYERCAFGAFDTTRIPAIRKDIRDLLPQDIEYFDAIAHLAGICNDPLGDLLPETTMDINCEATCRLARLAKTVGVERFVFSSSCSVYGAAAEG